MKKSVQSQDKKSVTTSLQQMAKVLLEAKKVNNRAPSFVTAPKDTNLSIRMDSAIKTKTSRNQQQALKSK